MADDRTPIRFMDLDLKFEIGNLLINVLYMNYEPPISAWSYGSHSHSSYELHYIPRGRGKLQVGQREYDIAPGTFYLTGPGIFHAQMADASDPMCEYCLNFELDVMQKKPKKSDTFIPHEIQEMLGALAQTSFWFGSDEHASHQLFQTAMRELQERKLGFYTVVQNLAAQIIVYAIRSFAGNKISGYQAPRKILDDSRRYLVDDYFKNPNEPLRAAELAQKIGICVRQLERVMRSYYGMTFHERLLQARVEMAKGLLLTTDRPIGEIAASAGFASAGYFSRTFKQKASVSPHQFRQNARKRDNQ